MKKINYAKLPTELPNPASKAVDRMSVDAVLRLMNREDEKIPRAVKREIPRIERAVKLITRSLENGGRIFFAGAGTSGRLGVLESAELPPTFGTPPSLARAFMAGGRKAVFQSREGAEDNAAAARLAIRKKVRRGDVVIGIAASGVTPFAQAALSQARRMGAKTIFVTCNGASAPKKWADITIAPRVGPEIIAGSTRLKSGTATKLVLNMLTTCSMVQIGKVYGNRMVDLEPRSRKLVERGIRLVQELTGLSRQGAEKVFRQAGGHVKTAVVMAGRRLSRSQAREALKKAGGFLRSALGGRS